MFRTLLFGKRSSTGKPTVHVTDGGRRYVNAEELLRSESAQKVLKGMAELSAESRASESPASTHGDKSTD